MGMGWDRGMQEPGAPGRGGHDHPVHGHAQARPQRPESPRRLPQRDLLRRCLERDDASRSASLSTAAAAEDLSDAPQAPRVSLEAEVPEALFEGMRNFLSARPEWDQYRVITSALAGFLFQNGCSDRCVAQHYLNGLFMRPGD